MKKLCYTTYDFFLDVDYPIVKELNRHYDLYWIIFSKISPEQRFSFEEVAEYSKENNIQFEFNRIETRYRSPKHLKKSFFFTLRIRKLKADIYYFQEFTDPFIPVFAKIFLSTKKIIVGIHDVENHRKDNSIFRRLTKFFYVNAFNNYHIFSEYQKSVFLRPHSSKNVLMARLCLKDFGSAKRNNSFKGINFLFFGLIEYYKGVDYLIKAANLLGDENYEFTVTIAGYTKDFVPYQKLIKDLSRFKLSIKIVPNNEIADLFINSDYLVLPYRDVTQSGPLKIAYNYGVPVIASNFPGFQEYIEDGHNGYLFEANNYMALYKVMKTVILLTDKEREDMRMQLKSFVESELKLEKIIGQYVDFFERI